jgi:hypothetical protein
MFEKFVEVADKILDAIQPAGGAQASEPQQQVRSAQHSVIVCHNIFVLAPPLEDPQPAMQPAAQCRLKHSPVWLHGGGGLANCSKLLCALCTFDLFSLQEPTAAVDSQGRRHSASLHPSSQAAQPTESGSQSGAVLNMLSQDSQCFVSSLAWAG